MLRSMLNVKHCVNIAQYNDVLAFIKNKNKGYLVPIRNISTQTTLCYHVNKPTHFVIYSELQSLSRHYKKGPKNPEITEYVKYSAIKHGLDLLPLSAVKNSLVKKHIINCLKNDVVKDIILNDDVIRTFTYECIFHHKNNEHANCHTSIHQVV